MDGAAAAGAAPKVKDGVLAVAVGAEGGVTPPDPAPPNEKEGLLLAFAEDVLPADEPNAKDGAEGAAAGAEVL